MNADDEQVRATIARQAGEWFVMHRAAAIDDAGRRAFAAWIKASPAHVEEYLGVALVAEDLPAAARDPELSLDALLERARSVDVATLVMPGAPLSRASVTTTVRPRFPVRARFAAAAAVIALLGSAFLWWNGEHITPVRYATRHGEQRSLRLADDSVLHLDTDTAVTVSYGRGERRVYVEQGQALFEVAHAPGRRFRVLAGAAEVIAVGTQFNVYREGDSTLVTVVEGQVTVAAVNVEPQAVAAAAGRSLRMGAGEQVRVTAGSSLAEPTRVDLQRSTAWLRRELAFEQQSLAVVAAEFNRYGALPIVIETPALQALTINGVFDADDTASFITFLRSLDGVSVEVTSTRIRVFALPLKSAEPATLR